MTTLTWLDTTPGDPDLTPLWDVLDAQLAEIAQGRATILRRHVPHSTGGIRTEPNRVFSDAVVLAAALAGDTDRAVEPLSAARTKTDGAEGAHRHRAHREDGLVIGCWGAPVGAVRSALGIPVTSPAEAAATLAGGVARNASVVTVAPALVPVFAADLARHGGTCFHSGLPVLAYEPETSHGDLIAAIDSPGLLIDRFDAAARKAVDAGADAIVTGCGYVAPILTFHGYRTVSGHPDVPVIDANRLAVEHVLLLIDLHRAGVVPSSRGQARPSAVQRAALDAMTEVLVSPG